MRPGAKGSRSLSLQKSEGNIVVHVLPLLWRRLLWHRRLRRERLRRADRLHHDAFAFLVVEGSRADVKFDRAAHPILTVRTVGGDERAGVRLVQAELVAALEGRGRAIEFTEPYRGDRFLPRSVT